MSINVTLAAPQPRPKRILRLPDVIQMSGLSRATIRRLEKLGLFPKSVKIGLRAIGWIESEVENWIAEREVFAITI
jgi:prophage regulatory protein